MTTLYYYIIIRNILNIRLKKVWLVGTVPENPQRHTTQPTVTLLMSSAICRHQQNDHLIEPDTNTT